MHDTITPLIITYNEAPNLRRTLEQLRWARDIVVVDSYSDDETLEIISNFPQARVFERNFDSFANQCNFGLIETGISTKWVLSLDADYLLTPEMIEELKTLNPEAGVRGYLARFAYCIHGRRIRSGVYPAVTVLFERSRALYVNDGHAHRVVIDGAIANLRSTILHDDRKPLSRWFESQQKYMALEARKIIESDPGNLGTADRVRRLRVIAPLAVLLYCLIIRGGVLDGWAGLYYAFQRTFAELLLSLNLIEHDLGKKEFRTAKREIQNEADQSSNRTPAQVATAEREL